MPAAPKRGLPSECYQAIVRWRQGHHAFHMQLVAMNTVIDECKEAVATGDRSKLLELIYSLAVLYDAATASMKYAADFPIEMYKKVVRPSMMPPFLSPGFSGTLNIEHTLMLQALGQLARALNETMGKKEQWPDEFASAWALLSRAKARNRSNHALICQKFVPDGVSLLRQFFAHQNQSSVRVE